ncbi:MAG: hypothetical protein KBC44_02865 [Candidatus Pacebacteria bacterium]|nr:hypothetical protein [Candidatus Paceibacterota bacterium]
MKTKTNKYKMGMSIIEIIFSLAILSLIALAFTMFSRNIFFYGNFVGSGLENVDAGRKIIKELTAELRTASTADTGAYVISSASASALTFYSDTDGDGLKERVRYFLNGTSLQKGTIKPTGSPLTYNALNEKITTLVYNVRSSSIFSYYDENYDGTTSPLSFPVTISSIRMIKLSLEIDRDLNHSPVPITFTTQVSIRNLKDNL